MPTLTVSALRFDYGAGFRARQAANELSDETRHRMIVLEARLPDRTRTITVKKTTLAAGFIRLVRPGWDARPW